MGNHFGHCRILNSPRTRIWATAQAKAKGAASSLASSGELGKKICLPDMSNTGTQFRYYLWYISNFAKVTRKVMIVEVASSFQNLYQTKFGKGANLLANLSVTTWILSYLLVYYLALQMININF